MAKYRVDRGGGEYVFPTLGIVANDGDIVDAPSGLEVNGLVPVTSGKKSDAEMSTIAAEAVADAAESEGA